MIIISKRHVYAWVCYYIPEKTWQIVYQHMCLIQEFVVSTDVIQTYFDKRKEYQT